MILSSQLYHDSVLTSSIFFRYLIQGKWFVLLVVYLFLGYFIGFLFVFRKARFRETKAFIKIYDFHKIFGQAFSLFDSFKSFIKISDFHTIPSQAFSLFDSCKAFIFVWKDRWEEKIFSKFAADLLLSHWRFAFAFVNNFKSLCF